MGIIQLYKLVKTSENEEMKSKDIIQNLEANIIYLLLYLHLDRDFHLTGYWFVIIPIECVTAIRPKHSRNMTL